MQSHIVGNSQFTPLCCSLAAITRKLVEYSLIWNSLCTSTVYDSVFISNKKRTRLPKIYMTKSAWKVIIAPSIPLQNTSDKICELTILCHELTRVIAFMIHWFQVVLGRVVNITKAELLRVQSTFCTNLWLFLLLIQISRHQNVFLSGRRIKRTLKYVYRIKYVINKN